MINSLKPEEIGLNQNITSPNLGIFQSSLCRGYFICGTPGLDEQLIDDSFPTFEVSPESIDCHTFDKSTSDKYQLPAQMIANNHRQSFSHALCTITEKNTKELSKSKLSDVNPEDKDTLLLLEVERNLEQEANEILGWTRYDSKSLDMFLQEESKPREFIRK